MAQKDKKKSINLLWLLAIGVFVQFGWEAGLLLGGIRSAGFATVGAKLHILTINSLLETNLGMPYIFCIFITYSARFTEQLCPRQTKLSFSERIAENNAEKIRK